MGMLIEVRIQTWITMEEVSACTTVSRKSIANSTLVSQFQDISQEFAKYSIFLNLVSISSVHPQGG